jgi:hypothetical protein
MCVLYKLQNNLGGYRPLAVNVIQVAQEAAHNNSCGSLPQLLDAPALDGGEWSASYSNHFTTGETVSNTH